MKIYINRGKILSAIVALLTLCFLSCEEDFLDKNPLTDISSPTFWNTQNDADMALVGCYARLNNGTFSFEGKMSLDVLAGDASSGSGNAQNMALGNFEATSGGLISSVYNDCFKGIASCNFFLANIDRTSIPEGTLQRYKGEVRFLRALFYFTLTDYYGGVPLSTEPIENLEDAKVAKSSKEAIIAQVISDLDFAIAQLPNTDYSSSGHAVKGSALALKSRVLLYQEDWAGAAAAAKEVMIDGKFSISDDFKNMFLVYGQDGNAEIMFSTRYLNPDNSNEQDIRIEWHGIYNPRMELRDAFECIDGLPITESPLYDPANYKLNRDPRLEFTLKPFDEPAIKASGEIVPYAYNNPSETGYMPTKGADVEALPIDYSTRSEHDWILLRYAEVLLNFAEATNEISGPTTAVYDAVNEVRGRTGIELPPLPEDLTKEEMRARIWNERRVEFAMEGLRYSDIRRWKLAETYINTLIEPTSGTPRVFDPSKHYLWPFPQSEIDVNPNLEQNHGY